MDASTTTWLLGAVGIVVSALCGVVGKLYAEVTRSREQNATLGRQCAQQAADIVGLQALAEQSRWLGADISARVTVNIGIGAGMVVEWSPGATALLGWTEREMANKSLLRIVPAQNRPDHVKAIANLLSARDMPRKGPVKGYVVTKSGAELPVNITLSGHRDGDGRFITALIERRTKGDSDSVEVENNHPSP